jgi:hypothetical protein
MTAPAAFWKKPVAICNVQCHKVPANRGEGNGYFSLQMKRHRCRLFPNGLKLHGVA